MPAGHTEHRDADSKVPCAVEVILRAPPSVAVFFGGLRMSVAVLMGLPVAVGCTQAQGPGTMSLGLIQSV